MFRRPMLFVLMFGALAAMSLPALAKPNTNASIKATIDITSPTKIGSTTLAPGQYNVTVEANQAKFEQDRKTVAEVPCTLKDLPSKAQETQFLVNDDQITEIQVSGKTQAIEFSANQNSGN